MIIVPDVILELHSSVSAWLNQFRRKNNFNRRQIFEIQRSNHVGISFRMSRHIPSRIFTHFQALYLKAHQQKYIELQRKFAKNLPQSGNPRQSWILQPTQWIPDSSYWITIFASRTWILDSTLRGIPDPLSSIPDSQAQDSGFNEQHFGLHKQTFSRFSNKDSLALGEKTVTATWNFNFFGKKMVDFTSYRSYGFWGVKTVALFIGS